jgi:drug/metabolite transporter (DMT)-like permease
VKPIPVRTLIAALVACDLLVFAGHMLFSGHAYLGTFFDLDLEGNLPTWYSSFQFILAGAAALLCYHAEEEAAGPGGRRGSWAWLLVAALMLGMSLDETGQLHEALTNWLMSSHTGENLRAAQGVSKDAGTLLWGVVFGPFLALLALAMFFFYFTRLKGQPWLLGVYLLAVALLTTKLVLETKEAKLLSAPGMLSAGRWSQYRVDITVEQMAQVFGTSAFVIVHYAYGLRALKNRERRG